jgi:hypothetical protein
VAGGKDVLNGTARDPVWRCLGSLRVAPGRCSSLARAGIELRDRYFS